MAHTFGSDEWVDAVWAALRSNEPFRRAAATWALGPVVFIVEADAEQGVGHDLAFLLDVHEGEVQRGCTVDADALPTVPFVLAASFKGWSAIASGRTDAIDALVSGVIRVRGDLTSLQRHEAAISALIAAARGVESQLPTPEPAAAS